MTDGQGGAAKAPAMRGRPPAAPDHPQTAASRFGWICRTLREYSGDPGVQQTANFAERLSAHLDNPVKTALVNRMETGASNFTFERLRGYEAVLGLDDYALIDIYIYFNRLETPAQVFSAKEGDLGSSWRYDLLHKIASKDVVTPGEWLLFSLSAKIPSNGELFESARYRDDIFARLLDQFKVSFERDERLLREALINLAPHSIPYIVDAVRDEPISMFNSLECLGFIHSKQSWAALTAVARGLDDSVQAQTLIEATRRLTRRNSEWRGLLGKDVPQLVPYCEELLLDVRNPYTAREEALALLLTLPRSSPQTHGFLHESRDDVRQLRILPTVAKPTEIVLHARKLIAETMEEQGLTGRHGATRPVPGLGWLLTDALFAPERVERLGIALALCPLPIASHIAHAAGELLMHQIPASDYGLQRSLLRLLTKLDNHSSHEYFTKFAKGRITDDGVRLTLAWAIGAGSGDDENGLRNLLPAASVTTRRIIALSASRRGFHGLLTELGHDPSPLVRREVAAARARATMTGEPQAQATDSR